MKDHLQPWSMNADDIPDEPNAEGEAGADAQAEGPSTTGVTPRTLLVVGILVVVERDRPARCGDGLRPPRRRYRPT